MTTVDESEPSPNDIIAKAPGWTSQGFQNIGNRIPSPWIPAVGCCISEQHPLEIALFMTVTVTGGCLCGSIRYEATGQPYNVTHCHCADCRRSSGAPFVTWAALPRSGFRFTQGYPRELSWAGRLRSFCPDCGTPLTFLAGQDAEEVDVTVCSFDQPAAVTPADHTWIDDRLLWIALADHLPSYARQRQTHPA